MKVSRPLAATFSDTELLRPNYTRLSRKPIARDDSENSCLDPVKEIVLSHRKSRRPLLLGKTVLNEETLGDSKETLLQKRGRDATTEGAEEFHGKGSAKKPRIEKSERDNELYTNENTVRPENLLMMVDSSLVDTPERRRFNEQKIEIRREKEREA